MDISGVRVEKYLYTLGHKTAVGAKCVLHQAVNFVTCGGKNSHCLLG